MTYLDPSTNYLYIVPEPYSPEDYQELENEIVGDDSIIHWAHSKWHIKYEDLDVIVPGPRIQLQETYYNPCDGCPNFGKGPCCCSLPDMYTYRWISGGI